MTQKIKKLNKTINGIPFKIVDGLPTSKYGIALVKRCKWCYNAIHIDERNVGIRSSQLPIIRQSRIKQVFCCPECAVEMSDWAMLKNYKVQKEELKRKYHEKKLLKLTKKIK